ncbi:C40 family peptidase [Marivivens aquimaris]|uniref:C40 family peptidase n=1 Tax=Marivivens aquimaris TaxID=2774876 RepID=UPI001882969D|nr:NlpC/P60 family protein [Marivivens aquimaris]
MTDRRTTPANSRVAAGYLEGKVAAPRYTEGHTAYVAAPLVELLDIPGGRRDRQLQAGTPLTVYEDEAGWSYVQSQRNGYVGYVLSAQLSTDWAPDHRISSFGTHVYRDASMKSPNISFIGFGAELPVLDTTDKFAKTPLGYVPLQHLERNDASRNDPVAVAELHLNVPYLWGGNSTRGIDCSGLVSAAFGACGVNCAGDSDLQEQSCGTALTDTQPKRGDLFFWPGHVAIVYDDSNIIHANAHHMAVAIEDMDDALRRIGPVRTHRRI